MTNQQTTQARWQHNRRLWLQWIIVNLVGGIGAAFVTYPVAETLFFQIPNEITAILASRLIPGALLGAILGVLQSLVVRRSGQHVVRWVALSSLGGMISSLLGESAGGMLSYWIRGFLLEPDPAYGGVMNIPARFIPLLQFTEALSAGFVSGAIVGGSQVIALSRVFRHTRWWVIGSAFGWTTYFAFKWLGSLLGYYNMPTFMVMAVSTLLPWVFYSAITGYVLFRVLTLRAQPNDTEGEA